MKHRRWNHLRAYFGGYFWRACPICQQPFGGHEHGGFLRLSMSSGKLTCPDCPGEWDYEDTINGREFFEIGPEHGGGLL